MEIRFLSLIAQFDLPRPRVNAVTQGLTVDFFWPARGLIAETDGQVTEHPDHVARTLRALLSPGPR